MSIYSRKLDNFSSKYPVFPTDDYEVKLATPKLKVISYKDKEGQDAKIVMLAVPSVIIRTTTDDKTFAGKVMNVEVSIDVDKDDGFDRAYKFLMATQGIKPGSDEADEEFRTRFGEADLSINLETAELGSGWNAMADMHVIVNMKQIVDNKQQPRNRFNTAYPFNA